MRQTLQSWAKKGEFKEEELSWSGVLDFLDARSGKVSKQEVLDYLAENNVKIQEVMKGEGKVTKEYLDSLRETALEAAKEYGADRYEIVDDSGNEKDAQGRPVLIYKDGRREMTLTVEVNEEGWSVYEESDEVFSEPEVVAGEEEQPEDSTKFSQYQVEGGKNYKELLLTLPRKPRKQIITSARQKATDFQKSMAEKYGVDWNAMQPPGPPTFPLWRKMRDSMTDEELAKEDALLKPVRAETFAGSDTGLDENYHSPHWDEPNVLAHIRFNERTDADGNRVLFIEEIQSDWHQAGRKKGYQGDAEEPELETFPSDWKVKNIGVLEYGSIKWEVIDSNGNVVETVRTATDSEKVAKIDALQKINEKRTITPKNVVPDVPFKKTWPMLAMKRMVRYAAENGYDSISWTPGDVQAARYDLSKQVDNIEWGNENGVKRVEVPLKQGANLRFELDENGNARQDKTASMNIDSGIKGKHVSDILGKEIAEKILKENNGFLEGEGLKVGGEGMKGFYDKILPAEVNKFFGKKAWGNAKVEVGKIQSDK